MGNHALAPFVILRCAQSRHSLYKYLLNEHGMTPADASKHSFNEFLGGGNLNVATMASCQECAMPAELLDGRVVEMSILNKRLRI